MSFSHLPQSTQSTRRSPNSFLSKRSRIMKTTSTHNSPSRGGQRRRGAQSSTLRPATYHAASASYNQAAPLPMQHAYASDAAFSYASRPMTWHPAFQTAPNYDMSYPQQMSTSQPMSQNFYTVPNPGTFQYMNVPTATTQQATMAPPHHVTGRTYFHVSPVTDGNQLPIDSLNLGQMPAASQMSNDAFFNASTHGTVGNDNGSTGYQTSHLSGLLQQSQQSFFDDQDDTDDDELVGMGLHDASTNYDAPSLLLGAGLDEHEKPTKAPKLTLPEELPPPEQVPDAIPDDGNDTPVTADLQDWFSPSEQFAITPHDGPQSMQYPQQYIENAQHQPQMLEMSGQSFFFDESTENQWYNGIPAKPPTTDGFGMNTWAWM